MKTLQELKKEQMKNPEFVKDMMQFNQRWMLSELL